MATQRTDVKFAEAKQLVEHLRAKGLYTEAETLQRFYRSSVSLRETCKRLYRDNMELRRQLDLPGLLDKDSKR